MSAAVELRRLRCEVTVIDDQPSPGGRIFAGIETRQPHGREDRSGATLARHFRESGGTYLSATEAWQIESGAKVFVTHAGQARVLEADFVLLAVGAQERPMPFPGWERPGVMTIGAAQILLKTAAQVPREPVWLAGSGPLLLLYARQLLDAGGSIAGLLDTTPKGRVWQARGKVYGALGYGWRDMARGLNWLVQMRGVRVIRHIVGLEAVGDPTLSSIRYRTADGVADEVGANLLLIHNGVVPAIHATLSAGCSHRWNADQQCLEPACDEFGRTSQPDLFVAGDGAAINGARAAFLSGRLAALGIAHAAGLLPSEEVARSAARLTRALKDARGFRSLIDTLYPPVNLDLPDVAMVCRCEEVTASQVREVLSGRPHLGADGVKMITRAGMGPCQGRQCGYTIHRLIKELHGGTPEDAGFLRVRPPLKPLTLGELASLEAQSA